MNIVPIHQNAIVVHLQHGELVRADTGDKRLAGVPIVIVNDGEAAAIAETRLRRATAMIREINRHVCDAKARKREEDEWVANGGPDRTVGEDFKLYSATRRRPSKGC